MSITQRVASGFRAMMIARAVQTITKGLLILLLTRVFLTPDQYGLLFLAISILTFLLLFSNLGFAKSGVRYLAEYRETDTSQVPIIVKTAFKFTVVSLVVVCFVLFLSSEFIAAFLDEPRLIPLLLIGIGYIVASTLFTFLQLTFQGFNRVEWSAVIEALSGVVLVLSAVGFLLLGFGVLGVMAGYVLGSTVAAVVGAVIMYRRFYTKYDRGEPEPGLKRRLLRYSVPLTATRGANMLDKQVDTILVGFFINPIAVGFYTLGKQVSEFLIVPAYSLGFSVSPSYGELKATEAFEKAAGIYEGTFTFIVSFYVPATVGLALVADPAVPLIFGQDYAGAVPVVQIFGVFVLLQAIDKITNDGLDYLGRAKARAVIKSGVSVGNFLLNLVMIPLFGVVGAALATVITYAILVGAEMYIIRNEIGVSLKVLAEKIVYVTAISVGMAAIVLVLLPYVSSIPSLIGVVFVGVAVWGILVEISGLIDVRRVLSQLA